MLYGIIELGQLSCFTMIFPLAVSSLNNVLAHTLWQPTSGFIAIFHKYCCFTKHGGVITNLTLQKSFGVYYWYVKIPQCGYMENGLKDVAFYVQKHIAPWTICYNAPLVCDMPLWVPAFLKLVCYGSVNSLLPRTACWVKVKRIVCAQPWDCHKSCSSHFFRDTGLTHWGRATHIWVGKLTIIGSDNGLSPERRQAIIWTNAGKLLIGPLGTNFSEILIEIQPFALKKIHLKRSSAKCCSFRLGLNVLTHRLPGYLDRILKIQFFTLYNWLVSSDPLLIMPLDWWHRTLLMINQHWFR